MLAFVDESGDQGRKLDRGSSLYFTVVCVTFQEEDEALQCDKRIDDLRGELQVPPSYEFRFSRNSDRVRQAFFRAIGPYPFFYHAFSLNKDPEVLYGEGFRNKESLYKFVARLVFENAAPHLRSATVVIDGSGERRFRDELATYLRRRIRDEHGQQIIKKVKVQKSHGNNLLQLADMVVGVMNRVVLKKKDAATYHHLIRSHELSRRVWPSTSI